MLTRLANLGIRAPRRVLASAGLLLVLAAVYGVSAASHLSLRRLPRPARAVEHGRTTCCDKTLPRRRREPASSRSARPRARTAPRRRARRAATWSTPCSTSPLRQPGACRTGRRRAQQAGALRQQGRQVGARRRARRRQRQHRTQARRRHQRPLTGTHDGVTVHRRRPRQRRSTRSTTRPRTTSRRPRRSRSRSP